MSEGNIVRYTRNELPEGKTDWARVEVFTEEELEAAVAGDPDAPAITDEMLRAAALVMPSGEARVPISIRVEREVLEFFKGQGPGYQSRINAVLSAYVRTHRL